MTNLKEMFGKRYKVVDDGTDDPCRAERPWCMEIPGKYGTIYPYGYDGSLAVQATSARMIKKLDALGLKRIQGGAECSYRFQVDRIDEIAALVRSRKRRHLSPERREKQIAALALAREARKVNSSSVSVKQNGPSPAKEA